MRVVERLGHEQFLGLSIKLKGHKCARRLLEQVCLHLVRAEVYLVRLLFEAV
jgi:hypothetical protein